MSSYHSNFSYLNKNSQDDFGWIIVHFDVDDGETDSYLSQEQVYTNSYNGARRILYGTKWNSNAIVKITVIKQDGTSFSVAECRNAYKWLTGNPNASWLDLYVNKSPKLNGSSKYGFLCTVQDVKPQKLDARTIGLNIYFESVSPWAYSGINTVSYSLDQSAEIVDDGVLSGPDTFKLIGINNNGILRNNKAENGAFYAVEDGIMEFNGELVVNSEGVLYGKKDKTPLSIDSNGVLYTNTNETGKLIFTDGVVDFDGPLKISINNETDDLYSYVYLDTTISNIAGGYISIKNVTLGENTIISGLGSAETVTLNSGQFISSDKPNKLFGNTFNFVWPRLAPGENEFVIDCSGTGFISFSYRYPIKIGDCAIDINVSEGGLCCGGNASSGTISGPVSWDSIVDTPTTIEGYGITNAYSKPEIDNKIGSADMRIDEEKLNEMLVSILGT